MSIWRWLKGWLADNKRTEEGTRRESYRRAAEEAERRAQEQTDRHLYGTSYPYRDEDGKVGVGDERLRSFTLQPVQQAGQVIFTLKEKV